MSNRTSTQETQTINGGITVTSLNGEPGIIEVDGVIYADDFQSNTINSHLTINGIKIKNSTLTLNTVTSPNNPNTGETIFYIDSSDNILKMKNENGNTYSLNPLINKGQLQTHNGTNDTVLQKGTNGYVLSVNDLTESGLKWIENTGSSNTQTSLNYYLVYIDNNPVKISHKSNGSVILCTEPLIDNGSTGVFLLTKNNSISSSFNKLFLNICRSLLNNGTFDFNWDTRKGFDIIKNYTEGIGNYLLYSNLQLPEILVTLSSTTQAILNNPFNNTRGCFFFSVYSYNNNFPSSNFVIVKSVSTVSSFLLAELNSSKGTGNTKLSVSWEPNSGIKLNKSTNNCDGEYKLINNFRLPIKEISFSLFNISNTILEEFNYYEKKSFFVEIISNVANGPCAVFSISKNISNTNGNIIRYSSPGLDNITRLDMGWSSNSKLNVFKTTNNYNGNYLIKIYFI